MNPGLLRTIDNVEQMLEIPEFEAEVERSELYMEVAFIRRMSFKRLG